MPGARRRGGLLLRKVLDRRAVLGDGYVLGAARLSARENEERVGRRVEICDNKRAHTVLAPRSGGDFGAEKTTTLMLPSSAGMMPTLTVSFSDIVDRIHS